jgi:diketogulonate reductase-like aldo/keto reductase
MMQDMTVPDITLNNGVRMPRLGFGVWQVPDDQAETSVRNAFEVGYRSIDTASAYQNEAGVGRAIRASEVPRDEIFVTTKLFNPDHRYDDALRAFDASLARLGLERLDLYLIHWPVAGSDLYLQAWKAMQKLLADGRVRAIGVCNFGEAELTRLMDECDVVPAVNQIELHPWFAQDKLRAFDAEHGIATEAWSPLGQGKGLLDLPEIGRIAREHDRSPAQVVLRWHLQLGNIAIPKSVTPSRIRENFEVFDFELSDSDMAAINALDSGRRLGPDPATFNWMG